LASATALASAPDVVDDLAVAVPPVVGVEPLVGVDLPVGVAAEVGVDGVVGADETGALIAGAALDRPPVPATVLPPQPASAAAIAIPTPAITRRLRAMSSSTFSPNATVCRTASK
jgi:hypothetical protein